MSDCVYNMYNIILFIPFLFVFLFLFSFLFLVGVGRMSGGDKSKYKTHIIAEIPVKEGKTNI